MFAFSLCDFLPFILLICCRSSCAVPLVFRLYPGLVSAHLNTSSTGQKYAFVEFDTPENAQAALARCNGLYTIFPLQPFLSFPIFLFPILLIGQPFDLRGRDFLHVEMAKFNSSNIRKRTFRQSEGGLSSASAGSVSSAPAPADAVCSTIYIGNITTSAREEDLRELLTQVRGFQRVRIQTKQSSGLPVAFAAYEDLNQAREAVSRFNGVEAAWAAKGGLRSSFCFFLLIFLFSCIFPLPVSFHSESNLRKTLWYAIERENTEKQEREHEEVFFLLLSPSSSSSSPYQSRALMTDLGVFFCFRHHLTQSSPSSSQSVIDINSFFMPLSPHHRGISVIPTTISSIITISSFNCYLISCSLWVLSCCDIDGLVPIWFI